MGQNEFSSGTSNICKLPTHFCDGGAPAIWDKTCHCLYYHTFFKTHKSDVALCSVQSVERLFTQGVEDTLASLAGEASLVACIGRDDNPADALAHIDGCGKDLMRGAFVDVRR